MSDTQCKHKVLIGLTELVYLCTKDIGHDGPHQIAISSEFCLCDSKNDITGLYGVCQRQQKDK